MAETALTALRLFGVAVLDNAHAASAADGTTLVRYRALSAIVGASAYSSVKLDDDEIANYRRVLEEVLTHAAVLPAPPGTVFKSRDRLLAWMELHYFTLTEALASVEGHSAARLVITSGDETTDEGAAKSLQAHAAETLRLLRGQAAATVMLPREEEDDKERIVARVSFLIDSEKWDAFGEAVARERKRQPSLHMDLSGPWPPYDFVRMQFGG